MARRLNSGYYISEGFHNVFSHGFMSFAAVCMIVACLLIMGTFTLLAADRQGVCFIRREEACWLVCGVNRGDTTWQFTLPPDLPDGRVVLATGWPDDTLPEIRNNTLELPALSGVWILRKNNAE